MTATRAKPFSREWVNSMIGKTVWLFDESTRIYTKPDKGRIWGVLVWREHWRPYLVVGETTRSWILKEGPKVPKNPQGRTAYDVCYSQEEVEDRCWAHDHIYKISDSIRRIQDVATLRRVADIIGYESQPRKED